jgi:hypothetical protein
LNVSGGSEIFSAHHKVYAAVAIIHNGRQVVGGEIVAAPNDGIENSVEMESSCGAAYLKGVIALTALPRTRVPREGVPLRSRARAVVRQTCHP